MMRTAIARELAPSEQTWDLTEIYATQEDWEADALGIEDDTAAIVAYRGRFGEGAAVLLACLRARDALLSRPMSYGQYARLPFAVDGTSPRHQEMEARASALSGRVNAALAFIDIEILGLDSEQVTAYLDEEPGLRDYRSQVEALRRRRPHTLSLEAEQLLAALADTLDTPYMVYQRTVASDLTFESVHDAAGREIVMSLTAYQALAQSPDREARRRAYESLIGGLDRHTATVAATLAACIRRNVTLARLRGYTSATEMALAAQQVPIATYRAFLAVCRREAGSPSRAWWYSRKHE